MKSMRLYHIMLAAVMAGCDYEGISSTGVTVPLPPQVREARVIIQHEYPEASRYGIRMHDGVYSESCGDWICLGPGWVYAYNRNSTLGACGIVREWYVSMGRYDQYIEEECLLALRY